MLTRLRLHNFRTFLNSEIELARMHLLIGRNNSGKTNLCLALRFLGATTVQELPQAVGTWIPGGIPELRNWRLASEELSFGVECELPFENDILRFEYQLTLRITADEGLAPPGALGLSLASEVLTASNDKMRQVPLLVNDGRQVTLANPEQSPNGSARQGAPLESPANATMLSKLLETRTNNWATLFRRFLRSWTYFSFSAEHMRYGWQGKDQPDFLQDRGDNLARVIFHLKNQDERRYRRFVERVRLFDPDLDSINFLVVPEQGIIPFVSLAGRERASWIGLSDGTLRAMGLSLAIELADRWSLASGAIPPLLIIEEPENGLFGGLVRRLLEDFDNYATQAQFIFTTHSPFVMDTFEAEPGAVTLLRRDGERTVVQQIERDRGIPSPEDRLSLSDKYFAELLP